MEQPIESGQAERLRTIIRLVKQLAAEYYQLTGKPLGVTGEVAEYIAADTLGLTLSPPRTAGYDATRMTPAGPERIQIKGRSLGKNSKPGQRMGRIKTDASCEKVLLVILDNATLDPREMWETSYADVLGLLQRPGSKARERGSLSISQFKSIAERIWKEATS
jgi:hypothetical protein